MTPAAQGRSSFVALVAAAVLVAQSFLTAWAAGAMPFGPRLDAFGNPLCITRTDDGGRPPLDHSRLPACCTFGCSTASPLLDAPDGAAAGLVPPSGSAGIVFASARDIAVSPPDHEPGLARAPPPTL